MRMSQVESTQLSYVALIDGANNPIRRLIECMAMTGNRSSCRGSTCALIFGLHLRCEKKVFRAWEEEHCHLRDADSGEVIGNGNFGG
jgi:hypothetical protein